MNILIDAYNVLKQVHSHKQVTASQVHQFIVRVRQFAQVNKHQALIVFDGGSSAHIERETTGPCTIIYSGHKQTADDVIKQQVRHFRPENTLVVTDDRQLSDQVGMAGFATMGSVDFYRFMQQELQAPTADGLKKGLAHKNPGYQSSPELDELMHHASAIGYYKELEEPPFPDHEKLSKKEKKLKKLVKKL